MAKWEAIDKNGETHSGDGREQLQALLNAGTLSANDGLHDEQKKKWTTVGQYLSSATAAAPAAGAADAAVDRATDRRQVILFAVLGGVVLLAVLAYAFADWFAPAPDPVTTGTSTVAPTLAKPDNNAPQSRDTNGRQDRDAAVAVGEEYDVLIENVGSRGDGLTHVKGMVVFVADAQEGDKLHVRITRVSRSTAQAEKLGPATGPVETRAAGSGERSSGGSNSAGSGGTVDRDRPSPVEMGKEYDVTIDGTGSRGDGIAHIEGLVIFVPGATKGQSVRVKITGIGARAAKAEIVR